MPADTIEPQPLGKLPGDIWGGFAAALVALPSSVAYGVASYSLLGPDYVAHGVIAGILGSAAMGLVASAFGGTPRLVSAPCAPAAAVIAALVAGLLEGSPGGGSRINPATIPVLLTVVALLSSGLQLLYGSVRGGQLIKFIPYPVVSGYLSGVGALIFLSQVPKFFGWPKGGKPARPAADGSIFVIADRKRDSWFPKTTFPPWSQRECRGGVVGQRFSGK